MHARVGIDEGQVLALLGKVAAATEQIVRARSAPALMIVAPGTLADLRSAFQAGVQARAMRR